tara:strand:+ start:1174 stop:1293 length:120 start_codon:yes stop_codon:yes gene_type:complete
MKTAPAVEEAAPRQLFSLQYRKVPIARKEAATAQAGSAK